MAKFGVAGNLAAVTTTAATMVSLIASANKRVKMYDWMIGADGTPADNSLLFNVSGFDASTAGTSTTVVSKPNDPGDPASDTLSEENYTVEPTALDGTPWIELPVNQRASYRWVAAPGGELILAATVNLKIVSQVLHASYTSSAKTTIHFEE